MRHNQMDHQKRIQCNIHGCIVLSEEARKIIDTLEFQRLREIKQLGTAFLVFPTATNTRFEHSLGVYHLAGRLLESLERNSTPEELRCRFSCETDGCSMRISVRSKELIKIAGLCHDLGHGPLSHVFDEVTEGLPRHEIRSGRIFGMINKKYNLGFTDQEVQFVKDLIHPSDTQRGSAEYQIICGVVDMDRCDYLLRDSRALGIPITFNPDRLILDCKVLNGRLSFPVQMKYEVYNMFYSRYSLFKRVYNHKAVIAAQIMWSDILSSPEMNKEISALCADPEMFCELTDYRLNVLARGHPVYERFRCHKLYKLIGMVQQGQDEPSELESLTCIRKVVNTGFSSMADDPFTDISFYDYHHPTEDLRFTSQDVALSPILFKEKVVYYFTRSEDPVEIARLRQLFEEICIHKARLDIC